MGPHILLVEDNALVCGALRILFEETGHRITVAQPAASALAAASAERPDVMLLDLGLPDADGLTVLEALVPAGLAPRRTIALTGDGSDVTTARCKAAGCDMVLLKPVSPMILVGKVREVMA